MSGTEEARRVWKIAGARIESEHPRVYEQWFNCFVPLGVDGTRVMRFGVPDDFFRSWILEHFSDFLTRSLLDVAGADYTFTLEVHESARVEPAPAVKPQPVATATAVGGAATANRTERNRMPSATFENFVVGEENRFAFLAAKSVAEQPGTLYNPLYLYGPSGVGKTHLLQAIAGVARAANLRVRYATGHELLNEFYDLMTQKRSLTEFRTAVREAEVLLVDDVHQLAGKAQIQEEFFNLFNTLHMQRRQIVLTSDKEPCQIQGLEPRLVTRFESGVTSGMDTPGVEARLAILRMMAANPAIQVKLGDPLLEFLAENISSSVRRLKGAFLRLATFASMRPELPLSIPMVEELLANVISQERSAHIITIETIQQTVADHFNVSLGDLLGDRRPRNIAEPRMIAMFLSRNLTKHSLPEIGKAFGKNHATILNAMKKIPELCDRDENLRRAVIQLEHKLK